MALTVEIKIPFKKLGISKRNVGEILDIALKDIKKRTPVDTGKLKRGIKDKVTPQGGLIYIEGKRNNAVAEYQHFGTKAHWIFPRRKKVLAWWTGRRMAFSMGHRVKGIKAKKFFKVSPAGLTKMKKKINLFSK